MKKINFTQLLLNGSFALFLLSLVLIAPGHSNAAGDPSVLNITLSNPLGTTADIPSFIQKILDGVIIILTPVVVVMFLWTGFQFVKAQGAPEELTAAKSSLLWTVIGAALVLGAKGFSLVIAATITKLG